MCGNFDSEKTFAADLLQYEGREDGIVAERLGAEIAARFGPRDEAPFSIRAAGPDGAVLAGVDGVTHWRWLYVRHLWVAEEGRGQGVGRRLLQEAERLARARGCVGLYLDTFDAGAAAFYERCGFARFGAIEDFLPGHRRIYLERRLSTAADVSEPHCVEPSRQ